MKIFFKKLLNKNNIILAVIIFFAISVRFYNFSNRVTFWSEQARSLIVSANYINDKPTLLGQEYFRTDSNGHKLFAGAVFNYSLVPLLIIFNYDPISITAFFAILNVFTGIVIYLTVKKMSKNESLALLSTLLFLFSDVMIYHSLFIWILNYLPLIGILTIFFLWSFHKNSTRKNVFWLGILTGLGISMQYLYISFAAIVFVAIAVKSKTKFRDIAIFLLGALLGNLPMIIFDIRHNFYHLVTLWQYTKDTMKGNSDAGFNYYYLLPVWPLFSLFAAKILQKISNSGKLLMLIVIALYVYINLTSSMISFTHPTGMPTGLTTYDISRSSQTIADDVNGDFNVAEVMDFDKRAYVLRYFIEFKYNKKPLSEIAYRDLTNLYVLAPENFDFKKSDTWEINASIFRKYNLLSNTGRGYAIYKLQK
jgi:hypothetical protein